MSDLGGDVGNSTLSLGAKAMQAILSLFEKIFDSIQKSPERKLKKMQLKEAKDDWTKKQTLKSIDGKVGYVNYHKLKKSGLPLRSIGLDMTSDEMKTFAEHCKRNGVVMTGTFDIKKALTSDNRRCYNILCKASELELVLKIVDRMNEEKQIDALIKERDKILSKGEGNLTEQDRVDLDNINKQIEAIQRSSCIELNQEQSEAVLEKAVYGKTERGLTLEEALNRNTGRHLDKDVYCIIADANDPSKYIRCHGRMDTYNGKDYIKTEYEVFHGSKKVFETHDGRFDGRPEHYWAEKRAEIAKALNGSGVFLKFFDAVEHRAWANEFRAQNREELVNLEKDGDRDYTAILEDLKEQLDRNGAVINEENRLVSKDTGKPLEIAEGMTDEERAVIAESIVIGKQYENYVLMESLGQELSIAKAEVIMSENDAAKQAEAKVKLSEVEEKFNRAEEKAADYIAERKNINAVQANQVLSTGRIEREVNIENNEIVQANGTHEVDFPEKPDERRDERVDEVDKDQLSMDEWKKEIETAKANNSRVAASHEVKELSVQKEKKAPAKEIER